jgi:hypothetical protein
MPVLRASAMSKQERPPTHLLVLQNGLFGHTSNWLGILDAMERSAALDESMVVLIGSKNERWDTFGGIDLCGKRLSEEVIEFAAKNQTLESISFVGHSMGGLICRVAIGLLYNPETQRISGLQPRHFITLATPHLGCDSEGEAEVPFISWLRPFGLSPFIRAFPWADAAGILLGKTGRDFFVDAGSSPLLLNLCSDDKERSLFFFSALASFSSRTCYANVVDDHLVGWSNAAIRSQSDCPAIPKEQIQKGKGVIREDPLNAGFWTSERPDQLVPGELTVQGLSKRQIRAMILNRLQMLPWRRIDVSFAGCYVRIAHNNIQITRQWINFEGRGVVEHLVETLNQYQKLEDAEAVDAP